MPYRQSNFLKICGDRLNFLMKPDYSITKIYRMARIRVLTVFLVLGLLHVLAATPDYAKNCLNKEQCTMLKSMVSKHLDAMAYLTKKKIDKPLS